MKKGEKTMNETAKAGQQYCLYLRKSRKDQEMEAYGEGETLARHEKTLLELAKKLQLNITQIYKEVVSGETIAARPVMQHLLSEVEQGIWAGVLVVEVERLARGDTIDQGIVSQAFKYSNTQIITPVKIYDPNNEFDEEYFEFGLFMSRREYKTINRRLQRGRITSVKEGKYVANKPPIGYQRVRIEGDKGFTLAINDEEADIVRSIYEWYTIGELQDDGTTKRLGTTLIARKLNKMQIPTRYGSDWNATTIRDILTNPIYIGKIRWNWRPSTKKVVDGQVVVSRPRSNNSIITDGLHPPIISVDTFNLAQSVMKSHAHTPVGNRKNLKNPLAGLVICGKCGHHMARRPYNDYPDTLMCQTLSCNNVSSHLYLVEDCIIDSLKEWLDKYKLQWDPNSIPNNTAKIDLHKKALNKLHSELDTLSLQLNNTYDLLEQGIYTTDVFIQRSRSLTEKINDCKDNISNMETELKTEIARNEGAINIIPKVEKLLEVYYSLDSPKAKNDMLKEVLDRVEYTKEHGTRWHGSEKDFTITLFPKMPTN